VELYPEKDVFGRKYKRASNGFKKIVRSDTPPRAEQLDFPEGLAETQKSKRKSWTALVQVKAKKWKGRRERNAPQSGKSGSEKVGQEAVQPEMIGYKGPSQSAKC